jgi:hypothetical protein
MLIAMFNATVHSLELVHSKFLILGSFANVQIKFIDGYKSENNNLHCKFLCTSKFWFRKEVFSPSRIVAIILAISLVIPSWAMLLEEKTCSRIGKYQSQSLLVYLIFLVIIAIECTRRIRKIQENFRIKQEIYGVLTSILMVIIYLILANFVDEIKSTLREFQDLFFILIVLCQLFFSAVYTLVLAMRKFINRPMEVSEAQFQKIIANYNRFIEMQVSPNSLNNRLEEILEDEDLRTSFEAFLVREFSVESFLFWKAVQTFKSKFAAIAYQNLEEAKEAAFQIYYQFCSPDAEVQINISSLTRENLYLKLVQQEIDANSLSTLFNEAEKECLELLSNHSLQRFIEQYRSLLPQLITSDQNQNLNSQPEAKSI